MSQTVPMRAPRENKTPRQPGVAILPPRPERTQIQPAIAAGASAQSFAEELAIFAAAMNKRPGALLSTLSGEHAERAKKTADALLAMTSADRRAKVAKTFAPLNDASKRLRAVISEAGPLLRQEMFSQLPPWLRADVSDIVRHPPQKAAPPLVTKLAARLIRESTR